MDLTIEFATGTNESISTLVTSNRMTPFEPNMKEINVSIYGSVFNTISSSKTLSSFKTSAIPHTDHAMEEETDLGHGTEGDIGPFLIEK